MEEKEVVNSELSDVVKKHLREMYELGRSDMKESILTGLKDVQVCFSPKAHDTLKIIQTLIAAVK
jgi:hypothetical protein